jgi:hypothetical protein
LLKGAVTVDTGVRSLLWELLSFGPHNNVLDHKRSLRFSPTRQTPSELNACDTLPRPQFPRASWQGLAGLDQGDRVQSQARFGDVTQHRTRMQRNEFSRGPIGQSVKSVIQSSKGLNQLLPAAAHTHPLLLVCNESVGRHFTRVWTLQKQLSCFQRPSVAPC